MPPELLVSTLVSTLTPFLLERIKWSRLPFLDPLKPTLNRVMAALTAMVTALGVTISYDAAAGTLTVTGLGLESVATAGVSFVVNLAVQQTIYRTAIDRR